MSVKTFLGRLTTSLKAALCILILHAPGVLALDNYFIDTEHTEIQFFYQHGGVSEQSGQFTDFDGELFLDEENPNNSRITVNIKSDSVMTGVQHLDGQLRNPYYLSAKEHPIISFTSTEFKRTEGEKYTVNGDLTIRGISRQVTIDLEIVHKGQHALGQRLAYYKGTWLGVVGETSFLRSEFDINTWVPFVSDEIRVEIRSELKKRNNSAE